VNARILRREGELGEIAIGARGDLLIVAGNPLEDLGVLADPEQHLRAVVKDGAIVVDRLDG